MDLLQLIAVVLDSTIRLSIPLICAAMAGLWSERAGVVDIGLEGKMLIAAFASAVAAFATPRLAQSIGYSHVGDAMAEVLLQLTGQNVLLLTIAIIAVTLATSAAGIHPIEDQNASINAASSSIAKMPRHSLAPR